MATQPIIWTMRRVAPMLAAFGIALAAPAAEARPGTPLIASVFAARKAHVPLAVFMTRHGQVVAEEWHSYTTPTQEEGPAWTPAQAQRLRGLLMGAQPPVREAERKVPWASFPVWAYGYPGDRWVMFESKRGANKIWGIFAVASWYWSDAISPSFLPPDDCEGWKLLNGKLISLGGHPGLAPLPSPRVRPRGTATPGFPSAF